MDISENAIRRYVIKIVHAQMGVNSVKARGREIHIQDIHHPCINGRVFRAHPPDRFLGEIDRGDMQALLREKERIPAVSTADIEDGTVLFVPEMHECFVGEIDGSDHFPGLVGRIPVLLSGVGHISQDISFRSEDQ